MQSSICLVECGSLKHSGEEELEEAAVVALPVVAVVLRPIRRRSRARRRTAYVALGVVGRERHRRPDVDDAARRARDGRRRGSSPTARPHDSATSAARSVPVASITAIASAANSPVLYASAPLGRSERPLPRPSNVTTRTVAGEVGDLRLPEARVDDRPGRQQQDRRLAGAVDLPEDADAVALDVAGLVRIPGAGLLAPRRRPRPRDQTRGRHRTRPTSVVTAAPRTRG